MLEQLFEESREAIEKHYDESSKKTKLPPELCGYRFLLSSKSTFRADIPIMIIDDHPGPNFKQEGRAQYSRELELKDYPYPSCEDVSAYIGELWDEDKPKGDADMQVRMRVIMSKLMELTHYKGNLEDFALNNILAFYGNPYRDSIHEDFIEPFLGNILNEIHPRLIFVFGSKAFNHGVLKHFGVSEKDVFSRKAYRFNYYFKTREVIWHNKKSLLVYMAPHSKFLYENMNEEQNLALNEIWEQVESFISDNNL